LRSSALCRVSYYGNKSCKLQKEARDSNRKKDLSIISAGLEQYYADNNSRNIVFDIQGIFETENQTFLKMIKKEKVSYAIRIRKN